MNKNFIPNYLTLCNIFCGFLSILTTAHGYYVWGTVFIFLAMLADRYDGIVARKLGVVSEIGHDLDSLCRSCIIMWYLHLLWSLSPC